MTWRKVQVDEWIGQDVMGGSLMIGFFFVLFSFVGLPGQSMSYSDGKLIKTVLVFKET